jgi:phasin
MINGTVQPFEIPNEMRAVLGRSVEQAKLAFTNYANAANEAFSNFDQWVTASQANAQGFRKKAIGFAQSNGLSALDFVQEIVQAKDVNELMQMQTEFVQSRIQDLTEQAKALGETATKAAVDSVQDFGEKAE